MNLYNDQDANTTAGDASTDDGMQTMSVLSTMGGGGDAPLPEGEALGIDPESGRAKLSGSTLAVGVVVVVGAIALLGMKVMLGSSSDGDNPEEDITQIDNFLQMHNAAMQTDNQGPIASPDTDSRRVLEELNADPTDHQVPSEQVATNPFDISELIAREAAEDEPTPTPRGGPTEEELRAEAQEFANRAAAQLTINAIAGNIVYINGEQCRVGGPIGNTGFVLEAVEGLTCTLRTTDRFEVRVPLSYQ